MRGLLLFFSKLIFFVTCWKQISKSECDEVLIIIIILSINESRAPLFLMCYHLYHHHHKIHKDEPHDNNTYLLKLFEKYGLKTQPRMKERHTLFSMFYKLTSPKCDPNKDLQVRGFRVVAFFSSSPSTTSNLLIF
jgi:hypothetical protein